MTNKKAEKELKLLEEVSIQTDKLARTIEKENTTKGMQHALENKKILKEIKKIIEKEEKVKKFTTSDETAIVNDALDAVNEISQRIDLLEKNLNEK